MKKTLFSALFVIPTACMHAQCPNLVANGDFESGNTAFTSQYAYVAPPLNPTSLYWEGAYAITTNPRNVHSGFASIEDHTSGSGTFMMVTNGSVAGNVVLWTQSVAVKSGTTYTFEAWGIGVARAYPARLKFSVNGVQVGNTFTVGYGAWAQFAANWSSGTATTALITIINENTEGGGNDFALDDIAFKIASVPAVSVADVSTFTRTNTIYLGYGPQSLTFTASASGGQTPYTYKMDKSMFSSNPSFTINDAGDYSISVKDANNCISINSASVNVSVRDVRCGNSNDKVIVCHNTSSTNNATNTQCISPSAVPVHLSHGDALGDCAPSTARIAHGAQSNIEDRISVFPNPARGQIGVTLNGGTGNTCSGYQITDVNGRVVLSKALGEGESTGTITIDVSSLVSGIYIIRALGSGDAGVSKFTIQ